MTFQCPDCFRLHDEPVDATFALAVRCPECSSDADGRVPAGPVLLERAA